MMHHIVQSISALRGWWSMIAYAIGFVPLTLAYYAQLWSLPHYQFFPWAFLGAWALAARRLPPTPASPPRPAVRNGLFALSIAMLAAAVGVNSPWLGCAASFVAAAAVAYDLDGANAWRRYGPAGLLLLTTLRLPLGADLYLITTLQSLTARAASATLDTFEIDHYLSGNVIVVPDRRLLVEEACSGVNSLFSAGCGTLFLLLWGRRSFIFSSLLLLSVPMWVVLANTARVTITAVLRTEFDIAADEGRWHDALGLAVFALAMLLIASTERIMYFYGSLVVPDADQPASVDDKKERTPALRILRPHYVVALLSLVLTLPQVPAVAARWQESALERGVINLTEVGAEFIAPPDGWHRADYQLVHRDRGSAFGECSQTWSFERGDTRAVMSLDYPFRGWHELSECYEMQGWQVVSRQINAATAQPPLVEIELHDPQGNRHALLLFLLLDRTGVPTPPRQRGEIDELADRVSRRLRTFTLSQNNRSQADESLTFQAQFLVETYHAPTPEERHAAQLAFRKMLSRLTTEWSRFTDLARSDGP